MGGAIPHAMRRMFRGRRLEAAVLGAFLACAGPGPAQAQQGPQLAQARGGVIRDIRVEGNQRIEAEAVRAYLTVKPGDPFDPATLNASFKQLFATGFFSDVRFEREGGTLVIVVTENPIINRIAFEGNDAIEDDILDAEVQLRPRRVFTPARVQEDVRRITDVYRASGRFSATVSPQIIELDQNRVDLVFEIDEGDTTNIDSISFIGNRAFSDGTLRGVIRTKESAFWRLLSTDDIYDPDRLAADRELLRRYYLEHGYADFEVLSAVAELAPDQDDFFITFTVSEGERYNYGNVEIVSTIDRLDPTTLSTDTELEPGDVYDAEEVEELVQELTEAAEAQGFPFIDVEPQVARDREGRVIDVVIELREGPRVFVERIDIEGNVRTLDKVIRREFVLVEGDPFNPAKVRRSRQRVQNLGFFETVEVTNEPGSAPDKTVVKVRVQEQSTGSLSFGAGYSSFDKFLGDVSIRERNLLGRGQDLRLSLRLSARTQEWDLGFTEPYFLDRNVSAGFDLFRITQDIQEESSHDEKRMGFGLRASYELAPNLTQGLRYSLQKNDITDVSDNASRFIKDQEGTTITSLVGQTLTYDKRDDRFDPREGYFLQMSNDIAGLGGATKFIRTVVRGGAYHELAEDWVLAVSAEAGYEFGYAGKEVGIANRFFLGGDRLRGFKFAGVGPRDVSTNDALGGTKYYVGSVELEVPLGLPEELGLRGRLFTDVGSLWDVGFEDPTVFDNSSIRMSVGVGFSWRSPFGPIRVDFGQAVLKEDFDKTEVVRFSFGTRF